MYTRQTIEDHLRTAFKLSEEQVETMLPTFIDTIRSHLAVLHEACAGSDLKKMARAAHTIKGAFLNLGLESFAEIALKIEHGGKSGDMNVDYPGLVRELSADLRSILLQS